ncbi:hypothetical protein LOTGIDRAFT_168080 [Lottia gigantea]|uniref:Alpha-type protein kinase domain-containing protein n=1 Tax=Lottia gigantea TaxID=225164 RepID=V4B8I9_LOTGI|nr:hypothetical protein LOTGIDRAFT_168080 [Lottia gigantea]ESO85059.1 hypothetical protein LOTGIDRAFT_168080 [Lottia gigantea]
MCSVESLLGITVTEDFFLYFQVITMPSISHTTVNSYPGRRGHSYWISFDFNRKYCGKRLNGYKGKFNGPGPRQGEFAFVKIPKILDESEKWCDMEISKNRKANELSNSFLSYLRIDSHRIDFTDSWKALMDDISCLSKDIRPKDWVLIEERIGKDCFEFINQIGRSDFGGCELLEAFVHWSNSVTNGRLVICNLDGIQEDNGAFRLKTPTIHSVDESYGESDFGEMGVTKVLKSHQCNPICSDWRLPSTHYNDETILKSNIEPSAPYLPQYDWMPFNNNLPPSYEDCLKHPS